mgnify:FL=1|tara:strand:+ start:237 stop:404 length:168 start_codon:yes stop_codon:yes gene_type:complete
MKKQESYKYNILCNDSIIFENLTEEECFDKLEDLAQDYYDTGIPHPTDLKTEIVK